MTDIVLSSGVANHLVTLATLGDSPWGLKVDYQVKLLGENVFSAVINAQGKMPDGHEGQAYSALTYDLAAGERLTLDALFEDVDAAVAWIEAAAEESLGQELSGYMEYSDITPLPREAFTLDGRRHYLLVPVRSAAPDERVTAAPASFSTASLHRSS